MVTLFRRSGAFLTWGLATEQWEPAAIVDTLADAGFGWIAQEMGSDKDPSGDQLAALRARCHERRLHFLVWQDRPRDLTFVESLRPNGWILNVESDPFDYAPLLAEFRARHPLLPAGIITNLDPNIGLDVFRDRNVKCIPECYEGDDPNATPAGMVSLARWRGYHLVFPAVGIYNKRLADYVLAGDGWSIYSAEYLTDDDLVVAKQWNGG